MTAVPNSPPAARPCAALISDRSIGAAIPAIAYVGRQPIVVVAMAITRMLLTSAVFLELTSATCPKRTAPRGLMIKPIANTPLVITLGDSISLI